MLSQNAADIVVFAYHFDGVPGRHLNCHKTNTMKQELLKEFDFGTRELLQLISSFSEAQLNMVPYEGSWTPGQVAEHVHQSDIVLLKSLNGPVGPTNRPPDEHVAEIRNAFLNFTIKMTAPAVIVPEKRNYSKEELLIALQATRAQVRFVIKHEDLAATCQFVEVKALGTPTRLELINFVIVHTQRHIHQLKKMSKTLLEVGV